MKEREEHERNLQYLGSRTSLPYQILKEEIHSGLLDLQVAQLRLLVLKPAVDRLEGRA